MLNKEKVLFAGTFFYAMRMDAVAGQRVSVERVDGRTSSLSRKRPQRNTFQPVHGRGGQS
ncbi:hypothetical protein HYPGJ_30157 [Hyphomicrobium sp. GJ21]|nr:hypothetical protein HYPGJ_30157 [Hyphomicrobium sp. GJ21]